MDLGDKIRILRKELGMSQAELAGNHLSKAMISHIETGRARPSMSALAHIANSLGRPLNYFLNDCIPPQDTSNISRQVDGLLAAGMANEAIAVAQEGLKSAKINGEPLELHQMLLCLGQAYFKSKYYYEALDVLEEAYEISLLSNNCKLNPVESLHWIANTHYRLSDYRSADRCYRKVISGKSQDDSLRNIYTDAMIYLGTTSACLGKIDEAENWYHKAIERVSRETDSHTYIKCGLGLVGVHICQQRYSEAMVLSKTLKGISLSTDNFSQGGTSQNLHAA